MRTSGNESNSRFTGPRPQCTLMPRDFVENYQKESNFENRIRGKESIKVWITKKKIGKERENSYRKMKISLDEGHTQIQTHENLNEIFWRSQMPFLIRRE